MRLTMELDKNAEYIINKLGEYGHEAYVVGGCVRDSIINKLNILDETLVIKDWDITTSAKPDEIIILFRELLKHNVVETGIKYGTASVILDNTAYEVTTFRIDGDYSNNRRPNSVKYTNDIQDDLSRRDLTINAVAYNHNKGFIGTKDLHDILQDFTSKTIKFVGNAEDRIQEDALRILRAMRFASVLGFKTDDYDKQVMEGNLELLDNISKERIQTEILKTLNGKYVYDTLNSYRNILLKIIPELEVCINFQQFNINHKYDVYEHTLMALDYLKELDDPIVKMAMLLHDIGKPSVFKMETNEEGQNIGRFIGHSPKSVEIADEILSRLMFSNRDKSKIINLVKYHDSIYTSKPSIRRAIRKMGMDNFEDLMVIRESDIYAQSEYNREHKLNQLYKTYKLFNEIKLEEPKTEIKDLNINGNDLLELGFKPGKVFGIILEDVMQKVINEELPNEKQSLLTYIKYNHINKLTN